MSRAVENLRTFALFWRGLFALAAVLAGSAAHADPVDISAAARGVVRVVIIERSGEDVMPVSHGTGFAVGPERIATNAHVVQQALDDPSLAIGIVPSDGENAIYARVVAVSPRNDLALLATTSPMNLPPLTISGNSGVESGAVTAVGYPQSVDRAQGLGSADIFQAQPPVRSTGFLSGRRPTREFDTLLHTVPIARGSSGGPLLDECGRVVGVNSFGAETTGSDAEFFFAVSTRELLPFLRANNVAPQINALPCRSIAELDAAERERAEQAALAARQEAERDEEALARRRDEALRGIEFAVMDERENRMAIAGLLLLIALGAGGFGYFAWERNKRLAAGISGGLAFVALFGAGLAWLSRPGFGDVNERLEETLRREMLDLGPDANGAIESGRTGAFTCTLDPRRSRVTGAANPTVPLEWSPDGCVNGRTQYGYGGDTWSRVLVPDSENAVSVNRFDPHTGEYRVERYLLSRREMAQLRETRSEYQAPQCGNGIAAAQELGTSQAAILSLLPPQPNERLVYDCTLLPD